MHLVFRLIICIHPAHTKPELMATGPNQVWSWDITKLAGPRRGVYYHLYVMIDIYFLPLRREFRWAAVSRSCVWNMRPR